MGLCINPPSNRYTNESWIASLLCEQKDLIQGLSKNEFAELKWEEIPEDKVPLVLIDNVVFTALLVCPVEQELKDIQRTLNIDKRSMLFYLCDKDRVMEFAN